MVFRALVVSRTLATITATTQVTKQKLSLILISLQGENCLGKVSDFHLMKFFQWLTKMVLVCARIDLTA